MRKYKMAIGKKFMDISLPAAKIINEVEGNSYPALHCVKLATREAMRNPIDSKPLREIVQAGEKVFIIVSDITRAIYTKEFLPTIVDELNIIGIPDQDIKIMIAQGTHRPQTHEEDIAVCGADIVQRIEIFQHDCHDEDNLVYLGTSTHGTPAYINKKIVEADRIILTGGITFHLMGGFGGGRKSIMPGVSGNKTIQKNHSIAIHEEFGKGFNPLCESAKLINNPLHEDMIEIAAMVNPDFLINVVFNADGKFARVVGGHWKTAWEEGCKTVSEIFNVAIVERTDLVIASAGGFPKDINLYQSTKTVENAFYAIKPGGVFIFFLDCPEIMDPPVFTECFGYKDLVEFETALRADFSIPAFIAFKCANIAKDFHCILITREENKEFAKTTGMIPVTTFEEAWELAEKFLRDKPNYTISVMGHGANTLPAVKK